RYHKITYSLNKLTFNWQTKAIAVSDDVGYSIKENIQPKVNVGTILNGVNTEYFQRITKSEAYKALEKEGFDFPTNRLVVGTVAVFRFQKRLEEWMEVFYDAKQQNPNLLGIIVGDGPFKERLVEKRKALGLEKDIIMPGLQTNTKAWFSIMDIFMMTSE
ncbi:glycosyltransferase, partial [Fulvivirga lutimaris]|uniref:glycosyltransferase n=1 Tax=Fulvivirga lutimaris TaxID=1819566 RepID=UPI0012BCFE99